MIDVRWWIASCAVAVLWPALLETARGDVPIRQRLQEVHERRQQVSYAFGGCDERRMDCSCFVQTTFAEEFGVAIPRSTLSQVRYLQRSLIHGLGDVTRLGRGAALCPGDLIYTYRGDSWRTSSRHVAISLGNGEILHAARGVGVSIQPLRVLGHHRLRGVVRLFDCRAGASTPPTRSRALAQETPDRRKSKEILQRLRGLIHEVFVGWERRDRQALKRLWAASAMQWTSSGADGFSEPTDWGRSLRELGGRKWRYWVHRLDVRGKVAFVEVSSELPCTGSSRVECGRIEQTFIWHREADGRWRIGQHEIGAAE